MSEHMCAPGYVLVGVSWDEFCPLPHLHGEVLTKAPEHVVLLGNGVLADVFSLDEVILA